MKIKKKMIWDSAVLHRVFYSDFILCIFVHCAFYFVCFYFCIFPCEFYVCVMLPCWRNKRWW